MRRFLFSLAGFIFQIKFCLTRLHRECRRELTVAVGSFDKIKLNDKCFICHKPRLETSFRFGDIVGRNEYIDRQTVLRKSQIFPDTGKCNI